MAPGPRPLQGCEYTAFISYAHADDEAWFGWVTQFRHELERGLRATLRGLPLPPLHLSADNGPVAGRLGEELRERIAASFAMIIVVHDNYAQSDWCLKELEYFRECFGDAGVRERLYVVAMSEPAILSVTGAAAWKDLLPGGEQLWIPFFDPRQRDRPIAVYEAKEVVNNEFIKPYLALRGDLVARIREPRPAPAPSPPPPPTSLPEPRAPPAPDVRIYIESNRNERTLWEPLGAQIRRQWQQLAGRLEPAGMPPLALRARGLPVDQIDAHPPLDDADGVVLLWGRKTADALIAQINKVENKMPPGRDAAPGIVAYLMPPQQSSEPVPAWGWQVLRFDAGDEAAIDVVADERDDLERFLRRVLERRLTREAPGAPR